MNVCFLMMTSTYRSLEAVGVEDCRRMMTQKLVWTRRLQTLVPSCLLPTAKLAVTVAVVLVGLALRFQCRS